MNDTPKVSETAVTGETKSQIQAELDRVSAALLEAKPGAEFAMIYVAQQALSWAQNPDGFSSPLNTIRRGAVWDSAAEGARPFLQQEPEAAA
jgi:hypothetical protein